MTKKKYIALVDFTDLQDKEKDGKDKVYKKGKPYPRPANKKVSDERLAELLSADNRRNEPVIKEEE
ncbi:hypothetical protein ACWNS2_13750 [Planococcus plakortidis]